MKSVLMASYSAQKVLSIHHWNDTLFSFTCTRSESLRFENGQFVMIGLRVNDKPLMRAYSIASANYQEHLEFFSIKVPNGPLTSRLQDIKKDDEILVGEKTTGTLVLDNLYPDGKRIFFLSTGTGLAPFMSLVRDPEVYERYDQVILFHGVRTLSELAYQDFLSTDLKKDEYIGEMVSQKLIYYPSVTREKFRNQGRLTDLIKSRKLFKDLDIPPFDPQTDRALLCGSMAMIKETSSILKDFDLKESRQGSLGHFAIERAFVD